MSREIKGVLLSRLIILVSIILVPIMTFLIFYLLFFFNEYTIWFLTPGLINNILIIFVIPLVYSISWLFFLILFANRFSETIDSMDRTVGIIPLRLKIFYGVNALFILFFFVFPLITPIIAILSFASFGWRLTTFRKKSWEEGTKASFFTKFIMILFAIIPIFCTICIIPSFLVFPLFLWNDIWLPIISLLYTLSYCLCTALAIGSLFILIANRGVSEYEQFLSEPKKEKSMMHIKIFELLFFIFLFVLALYEFAVIEFFYYSGFIIVIIVSIVNHFSGKNKVQTFRGHVFGYIIAGLFLGINYLAEQTLSEVNTVLSQIIGTLIIVGLASIFIIIFFYTFLHIDDSEFS